MSELTKIEIRYPPSNNLFVLVCNIEEGLRIIDMDDNFFLETMDFRRELYGAINRIEATRFRADVDDDDLRKIFTVFNDVNAFIRKWHEKEEGVAV